MNNSTQRFVSLHGFFAFAYPTHWLQETDEAGHYIFYQPNGGQGVLRLILLPNEFSGEDAAKKMLDEVYKQNSAFEPVLYAANDNRFVSFVKEHDVAGVNYTVYYWATAKHSQVVLFTYTVQTAMKTMDVPELERQEIEGMIGSFEFLKEEVTQH
jgi:hypothetical protein